MPVAPGMRRGPRAVPRDRSQGLAALGFFQSFTRIAFRNNDPRIAGSEAGHAQRGRRLPDSGPDAIPGPPAIRAPEGRLVPRSRTPDRVWARAARALAAGYTPRQVSESLGIGPDALRNAWKEADDFRYRTYWEYHAMIAEARARLRRNNAYVLPAALVPDWQKAMWARMEAAGEALSPSPPRGEGRGEGAGAAAPPNVAAGNPHPAGLRRPPSPGAGYGIHTTLVARRPSF